TQSAHGIEGVVSTRKRRCGGVSLAFTAETADLRERPVVTLVETLIGKGCPVRIYDPKVRIAALVGANRLYIEKEIPHITSLMCEDMESLLAHADVVVIGSPGEDATRALAQCRSDQIVVDLTRGSIRPPVSAQTSEEQNIAWRAIQHAIS